MTGPVEVDYRELLDAEGTVVGYVDPEGVAHEFPHVEGEPTSYPFEGAREHGKVRTTGDPLLVPESALFLLDDDADAPDVDPGADATGLLLGEDVDALDDDAGDP